MFWLNSVMSAQATTRQVNYTWDDYRTWSDDERWEIIGGQAYAMSPAPGTRHQGIQRELTRQLGNFFLGKRCQVFPAPTDVKLSDIDTVQPDLAVVCDPRKIKPTHIEGAPDLVVEVLSPSSETHDRIRKIALYARSGVREVWLVRPYPWLVEVFVLDGDSYRLRQIYGKDDTLASPTLKGLKVKLDNVFDFPLEPGEETPMIREGRPKYGKR